MSVAQCAGWVGILRVYAETVARRALEPSLFLLDKRGDYMKQFLAARPWWANALLAFCAYVTVIYLPFDLFFKPVSDDQEVWFGILFSG